MAQKKIWNLNFDNNIPKTNWFAQTDAGIIVSSNDKIILGIDQDSGSEKWRFDRFIKLKSLNLVEKLNILIVESKRDQETDMSVKILCAITGEMLFDSKMSNLKLTKEWYNPENKNIILEMRKANRSYIIHIDKISNRNWIRKLPRVKNVHDRWGKQNTYIDFGPYESKDKIILSLTKDLLVLDSYTGNIIWEKNHNQFLTGLEILSDKLVYTVNDSRKLYSISLNDIKEKAEELKLKNTIKRIQKESDKEIIIVFENEFNILNVIDMSLKWEKTKNIPDLTGVISHNYNFICRSYKKSKTKISLINSMQKKIWSKSINSASFFTFPTKNAILCFTEDGILNLNYEKGKKEWVSKDKFKQIPAIATNEADNLLFVFHNKKAKLIDLISGESDTLINHKIMKEIGRESNLKAKYIKNEGYLVYNNFSMAMISETGVLKYHKSFNCPKSFQLDKNIFNESERLEKTKMYGSLDNIYKLTECLNLNLRFDKAKKDLPVNEKIKNINLNQADSSLNNEYEYIEEEKIELNNKKDSVLKYQKGDSIGFNMHASRSLSNDSLPELIKPENLIIKNNSYYDHQKDQINKDMSLFKLNKNAGLNLSSMHENRLYEMGFNTNPLVEVKEKDSFYPSVKNSIDESLKNDYSGYLSDSIEYELASLEQSHYRYFVSKEKVNDKKKYFLCKVDVLVGQNISKIEFSPKNDKYILDKKTDRVFFLKDKEIVAISF